MSPGDLPSYVELVFSIQQKSGASRGSGCTDFHAKICSRAIWLRTRSSMLFHSCGITVTVLGGKQMSNGKRYAVSKHTAYNHCKMYP